MSPWAPLHWTVALLLLGGTLTLTGVSAYRQPRTRALAHLALAQETSHRLPPTAEAIGWWRQELNLSSRPAAEGAWTIGCGDEVQGYRLHVLAEGEGEGAVGAAPARGAGGLRWRLERVSPGHGPRLLAGGRLDAPPRRLILLRRDEWLEVRTDSLFLARCMDLLPLPATRVWWARTPASNSGQETMDVVDELTLRPSPSLSDDINERDIQARRQLDELRRLPSLVSQAIAGLLAGSTPQRADALQNWQVYVDAARPRDHDDEDSNAQMALWLAWAACQAQASGASIEPATFATTLDLLTAKAAPGTNAPQMPGLLMALADGLLARLGDSGTTPVAAESELTRRGNLLGALDGVLHTLLDAERPWSGMLSDSERTELQLTQHLTRILTGSAGNPTPASAPAWAAARWRASAGTLPIPDPLPPLPAVRAGESWTRNALLSLLDQLGIGPSGALHAGPLVLRAQVLTALGEGGDKGLRAALGHLEASDAPAREAALTRAILAARGQLDALDGLLPLLRAADDDTPLVERDPLAWALYRLVLHRHRDQLPPHLDLLSSRLPPALSPYARLLSGRSEATRITFSAVGGGMPPAEALAAALAMQEVAGLKPDWSKRRGLPSLTLPLALLETSPNRP